MKRETMSAKEKSENSAEDFMKAVSDFIKGKAGAPDMNMANISWDGENPPELPAPVNMAPTFAEIAEQQPIVVSSLKKSNLFHTAALFGGMLTLPELQANGLRLEALAHLSVMLGKGKERPTPARVSAWFNQMDNGICGRLEDPAEDVFIANVYDSEGNYRIFEGTAEGNAFHVQILLDILETMPRGSWGARLRDSVHAILKLSDAIVERAGLDRNIVGLPFPRADLPKAKANILNQVRNHVVFSKKDLLSLNVDIEDLSPFIFDDQYIKDIPQSTLGNSPLEAMPILLSGEKIAVCLPNAIGLAVRRIIIETCIQYGMRDTFEKVQSQIYSRLFHNELLFGKYRNAPVLFHKFGKIYTSSVVLQIDEGRYLHFVFFCDGLQNYEATGFVGMNPIDAPTKYIEKSVEEAKKDFASKEDFKEAITLVIGCGWGRTLGAGIPEDTENWRIISLAPHDLCTLSRKYDFKALDLFRVLDSEKAIHEQGIFIMNANGLLNLYAWMKDNKGHIVPHEKLEEGFCGGDTPAMLTIPQNGILSLRAEILESVDMHNVPLPSGEFVTVRRTNASPRYGTKEYAPFYADIFALENGLFRSVYEYKDSLFWIEVPASEQLDRHIIYHLSQMVLHWAEQVCCQISENKAFHNITVLWRFAFLDDVIPTYADEVPDIEAIRNLVSFSISADNNEIVVQVKKGFLAACGRADNAAETEIVRALISSVYQYASLPLGENDLETLVQTVVSDVGARHFHVFSTHDIRDYLQQSLPEHGQIISNLDDTESRIGLGWTVRERSAGENIEGQNECCQYLSELVKGIGAEMKNTLARFNRADVIKTCLINHEALYAEEGHWMRTFRAVRSISDDPQYAYEQAINKLGTINASTLASRIIIEMAVCECPERGGSKIGKRDLGQLMASASQMFHFGGYSDAMKAGAMKPVIRISPAGDVLMEHDFTDDTVRPLGQKFQEVSLSHAAEKYQDNYIEGTEEIEPDATEVVVPIEDDFAKAWQDEFGFTLDDTEKFGNFFKNQVVKTQQPLMEIKRSDLICAIEEEAKLSSDTVKQVLATFTLSPRTSWDWEPDAVPSGYLPSAWHPWRFRRQLSLISKPIVQVDNTNDPVFIIAPTMVVHHMSKFLYDARRGYFDEAIFRKGGLLAKWIGRINKERGSDFNEKVAESFREIGWNAEANLTDGKLLDREKDPRFGDVDVLAWRKDTGQVLVIECKDLSLDKTFGEIARRLAKYRGIASTDGKKRDELKRHLDRYEDLKNNTSALEKFVKCTISSMEAVLVFSKHSPMQFDKKIADQGVVTVSMDEIASRYSLSLEAA